MYALQPDGVNHNEWNTPLTVKLLPITMPMCRLKTYGPFIFGDEKYKDGELYMGIS